MKKTLLFSVIIGMYVLLCGCPYEYTDTTKQTGPTPLEPIAKTHTVAALGTGSPVTFRGADNIGTFYNFSFTLSSASSTMYGLSVNDTCTIPLIGLATTPCYCYFYDTTIGTKTNTIMEVLQPTNQADTAFNHLFSMVTFDASSGNITSILPFPAAMTNSQYQPGETHPANSLQYMEGYLVYITRLGAGGGTGKYPPNTDAGYDNDSEIKTLALVGATGGTGSTGSTGSTGGTGGTSYNWSNNIIVLLIMAIVLLFVGLFIGRAFGRNMTKRD